MAKAISSLPPENSRWVRGQPIGKGSFGIVSVGYDRVDGRLFAVKSVAMNAGFATQVAAIENEISILRSLSSPFIVKYYADDTTEASESAYRNLHMEYLPGGTAAEVAESGVADELVRRRMWCVVSALNYVHSRGVVHCDVKGRNVLLGPTPGTAKLADFGSAKMAEDDRRVGFSPRGSPLWMAPEVVRGESQGYASDVWALGCTLIEMVTGAPAWQDEGADTLCRIGYSDELPQFPTRLSDLGKDFLEKCLRRDPVQRWSCDQLLQHPFLQFESTAQMGESCSPRSVIEWPRLEASDDEVVEEHAELAWGSDAGSPVGCSVSSAGKRIGKLACPGGANWESDGWAAVRGIWVEVSGSWNEVGTNSEFSEELETKVEFQSLTQVNSSAGCSGAARGGCGGDGWAVVEESETTIVAAKNTGAQRIGELLYVLLWILYYTNHLKYHNDTINIP